MCKELGDAIYEPPVINSFELKPDGSVYQGDTLRAVVKAVNPEKGKLTYKWEALDGGTFIPPFDLDSILWIAPFEGGEKRIRAVVSNDKEARRTNSVVVQSLGKPLVRILSPSTGENFLINQPIEVEATAYHDNDLSKVWLLVNDVPADSQSWTSSNNYLLRFTPTDTFVGPLELKVFAEVLNQPGNTNADYITVFVQGIIQKTGRN
jgi:hypothetical protein